MAANVFISVLQISGLLSCLISLICVLFICAHYWILYKKLEIVEILSVLSIIGFGISGLSSAFYFMFNQCGLTIFYDSAYCNIWTAIWIMSWRFAIVMMSVLYLKRLQLTFDHLARYKTPKKIYNFFYVLNALFVISSFITGTVYLVDEDPAEYATFFAIATIISQILQFIISIGLIKLYIDKLFVLNEQAGLYFNSPAPPIADTFNPTDDEDEDSDSAPELSAETADYDATEFQRQQSNNPAQKKILGAISKITVLSTLAIISSEAIFTFQAIGAAAGWFTDSDVMMVIWYIGWDIDVVVNAICLFLSFDFNDNVYQKWCCGLHRCCMWTCDKCSRRKQAARNANDLEESLISL